MKVTDKKCLIAYFSRKGQNYVSGRIVDLKVGNTEVVAKMIQKITGGDMFHIARVAAYPKDYTEATEVAKNELRAKARPKLTGRVETMRTYDVIFLGISELVGNAAHGRVRLSGELRIYLERQSLPFCTHEGSGMGARAKRNIDQSMSPSQPF